MFQFLYGAIKTMPGKIDKNLLIVFQFLYGAIKTLFLAKSLNMDHGFNSSMVRLKHQMHSLHFVYQKQVSIPLWCD